MFFPVGDENPSESTPYVNYGIIGLNVLVFVLVNRFGGLSNRVAFTYGFLPGHPHWYTIFTSMFLHANLLHILGNMWFLWIVGDNVEDKLGHYAYLGFYLLSGVCAVLFYMMLTGMGANDVPLVGASGAIAGVLGCYVWFFPRARIKIFYFIFILFGIFALQAKWVIGIWIGLQVFEWLQATGSAAAGGGVAFAAHIGGFAVGIGIAILLKGHLRRSGRISAADRYTGFSPDQAAPPGRSSPRILDQAPLPGVGPRAAPAPSQPIEHEIEEFVKAGLVDEAATRYREYAKRPGPPPIAPWAQIEVAGELFREKEYEAAIEAYRRYLGNFPTGPDGAEAKFRLGVLLSRHRHEYYRAREYLLQAASEHSDPSIVEFARNELRRIEGLT